MSNFGKYPGKLSVLLFLKLYPANIHLWNQNIENYGL